MDSETGEPLERSEIVKGYKLEGDQYVILEAEELRNLQVKSSRILDLEAFVHRASVDPIYMDAPYYIYPEKVGLEAYRVIAEAMAADKKAPARSWSARLAISSPRNSSIAIRTHCAS